MAKDLIMVMGVQRSGTTALFKSLAGDKTLTAWNESIESAVYYKYRLRPLPEIAHTLNSAPGTVLLKPLTETLYRPIESLFQEYQNYSLRFVWIYRDPVNVLYSMHRQGWLPLSEIGRSPQASEWERRNRSALQFQQKRPEQIAILRYEDCFIDQQVFRDLTTWLGLKTKSLFRKDSENGRKRVPIRSQNEIDAATTHVLQALDAARTFRPRPIYRLQHDAARTLSKLRGKLQNARAHSDERGPFDWKRVDLSEPLCSPSSIAGLQLWVDASVKRPGGGDLASALRDCGPRRLLASNDSEIPFQIPYLNGKEALFFPRAKVAVRRENASGILRFGAGIDWTFLLDGSPFSVFALFKPEIPDYAPHRQRRAVLLRVAQNNGNGPAFALEWDGNSNASKAVMIAQNDGRNAETSSTTPGGSHPHQEWRIIQVLHETESGGTLSIAANLAAGPSVNTIRPKEYAAGTLAECGLELGGNKRESEAFFYGAVTEVIIFNRALSSKEQLGLTRYLKEKYQL